jgi:two-component system sensor histidine kinase TctE
MLGGLFFIRLVIGFYQTEQIAERVFDEQLLNTADSLAARMDTANNQGVLEMPSETWAIFTHNHKDKLYYEIFDTKGSRLAGNYHFEKMKAASTLLNFGSYQKPEFLNIQIDGTPLRMVRAFLKGPEHQNRSVVVVTAETTTSRKDFVAESVAPVVLAQGLVLVLSLCIVSICIDKSFAPLTTLAKEVSSRTANDVKPIADANAPVEVQPLLNAFNIMCSTIQKDWTARERFVANAAHQLRTPIAALKTYASFGCTLEDLGELQQLMKKMDFGLDVMTRLVNQLLVLARTEDAAIEQKFGIIELNSLVAEMVSLLVASAENKEQNLIFEPATLPAKVNGEIGNLRQLVTSLIENAIQYAPEGSTIFVRTVADEFVKLIVEDQGPGIPTEEAEKIFERFYRIRGASGRGSGLGLSIVKEVANSHNATIAISKPIGNQGTIFTVSFPRICT